MSINGPRSGRGLFPEEEEEEAIPFASLEKSQRSVTMQREFYSLPTPWLAIGVNLIVLVFVVLLFVPFQEQGSGYKALLILYIAIWVIIAGFNRVMKHFHNNARRRGYFQFYSHTKLLLTMPLLIWSAGMAFIALLFVFVPAGTTTWGLYPVRFLQIFCGLQLAAITIITIWYCVHSCGHNRRRALPDATEYLQSYEGNKSLAEKQAEVIQYMEQKVRLLGREVVGLYAQLESQKAEVSNLSKSDVLQDLKLKDAEISRLESRCASLQTRLDQFEKQQTERVEERLSETTQELNRLTKQLEQVTEENHKLRLMYEVEKDSLVDAIEEIEFLRKALADNGTPIQETTVYDETDD